MSENQKPKSLFQNWISVVGKISAAIWSGVIFFLFVLDFVSDHSNPYIGGLAYVIFPGFLILSLLLIPFGAWRERRQRQKRGYVRKFPLVDFNNPTHQKWAYMTLIIVTVFLLCSVVGAFHAYEYTESVSFCGKLCHQVMQPEYTTYYNSPHARVACAECHIGPGAGWFVRSKLSGAYQVYSVLFDKYHRPIETPIKNLRPAQETCEQCHWPEHFFGAVEQDHEYFLPDEQNTQWRTRMLMFVGGGEKIAQEKHGIHDGHMNKDKYIEYVSTDGKREEIPWVKKINADGTVEIFVDEESGYSAGSQPEGEMRRMDCIDCHNRPSHIYRAPFEAVNEALSRNLIDRALPFVKREAVEALTEKHASYDEAEFAIEKRLREFYQKKYPDIWAAKQESVEAAVRAVKDIYRKNFFPHMKADWRAYPNHIGHMMFEGCFRCHDGKHRSESGRVIPNDCNSCHHIIVQGTGAVIETSVDGLEFKHPEDIGEAWKEMSCYECHTG